MLDNKYSAEGESDRSTDIINLDDNNLYFGAIVTKRQTTITSKSKQARLPGSLKAVLRLAFELFSNNFDK